MAAFVLADGESGMEDETRSVSGFLHFDTVSKGLWHFSIGVVFRLDVLLI